MKLHPKVRSALDETGLPWELRHGSKHKLIYVDGQMLAILPHGAGGKSRGSHHLDNLMAALRRFCRERGLEPPPK
jgi:hypothetical protein